jgi:hypothetical protein
LPAPLNKASQSPQEQTLALPAARAARPASEATAAAAARGALFIEKRREARYPTNDPAELEIVNGGTGRYSATVLDVSRSGLCLKLDSTIKKGAEVKVTLPPSNVIHGQIRYCRPRDDGFEAGVLIQKMSQSSGQSSPHIEDDLISLYVVGKGLTVPEVIKLKEHLINCESCRIRLGEKNAVLNPVRKRKILATHRDATDH